MHKTGVANLPLHTGKAPRWLFDRMKKLSGEITKVIVEEYGPEEMLRRLSDPFWFQSFGCVLAFDWHSSGVTTTVCGALKESVKGMQNDLGLYVCGGKGAASRKTPLEIEEFSQISSVDPSGLIYASRMSAKVDSAAVQDGYQLYHHTFIFTKKGNWCVVQQGMNEENRYARRYHWLGEKVEDFVCQPHAAVCCDHRQQTLNMVAEDSSQCRSASTFLSRKEPEKITSEVEKLQRLDLPLRHKVLLKDINSNYLKKILLTTYQKQPSNFEDLLQTQGVGPRTIRALSLLSELIFGAAPSFEDPARFSFAHGGKDGHPYPVDRKTYDSSIEFLKKAIRKAKLGNSERIEALKRLSG